MSIMSKRLGRQNGTRFSAPNPVSATTAGATASRTAAIANNGIESPKILTARQGERLLRVRVVWPSTLADDTIDVSSASPDIADESDDSSATSDASTATVNHRRPKKPSAVRGERPRGFTYDIADKIDFTSSKSIEEHIPPYKGRGELPFPTYLLLDSRGNVNKDIRTCWSKVADWRRLTKKRQMEVWEFDADLEKVLKKKDRKLRQKEKRDKEEAAAATRKVTNDANRVNNRRARRQSERDAAREATAAEEEEVQVSLF